MFLGYLLLLFLVIPAIMVAGAAFTPLAVRLWITFILFPAGLLLFAFWRYARSDLNGRS